MEAELRNPYARLGFAKRGPLNAPSAPTFVAGRRMARPPITLDVETLYTPHRGDCVVAAKCGRF